MTIDRAIGLLKMAVPMRAVTMSEFNDFIEAVNMAIDALENLPPAEPRRKGKWIEHHEPYTWMGYTYWTCSECNFGEKEENKERSNFCPDCGVDMREDEKND